MKIAITLNILIATISTTPHSANATEEGPTLLYVYKYLPNSTKTKDYVTGLVNMDSLLVDPGDNCSQMTGAIKIEGVQYSPSGATLESFRFTDHKGNQYSVPTNITKLSNGERGQANRFIRQGKTYFAHIQMCGSGGYASLINLYDLGIKIGIFE
ncbi:MAG: hypothetical protein LZF63_01075 [Nitrosomonas sp.]|nr:hypothetical protein [Nitrosomonas sp.]